MYLALGLLGELGVLFSFAIILLSKIELVSVL